MTITYWQKGHVTKLGPCAIEEVLPDIAPILVAGEEVLIAFKSVRDFVAFTGKRLIAVNLMGATGKKRQITMFPYGKFHLWSVETPGGLDQNSILELNLTVLQKVRFEFRGDVDILNVAYIIGSSVL